LGWDSIECIHVNAAMAAEGGASWLTIHARTRAQGYTPPVFWPRVGQVRSELGLPVVANGDIWNFDDFLRCRDETGCNHFMIGRGALASPLLPRQIAAELGIGCGGDIAPWRDQGWIPLLRALVTYTDYYGNPHPLRNLLRFKQWLKLARNHGNFAHFDVIKQTQSLPDFFECLSSAIGARMPI